MLFNVVFCLLLIILGLVMIGFLEIYLLNKIGLDMVENFEASMQKGGIEFTINGGLMALIIVVQPFVLGILALKFFDKILKAVIIEKTAPYTALKVPKSGPESKPEDKKHIVPAKWLKLEELPPVDNFIPSDVAAIPFQESLQPFRYRLNQALADVLWFRGSFWHNMFILGSFVFLTGCLTSSSYSLAPYFLFAFLTFLIGPSLALYLIIIAKYSTYLYIDTANLQIRYSIFYDAFDKINTDRNKVDQKNFQYYILLIFSAVLYVTCYFSSIIEMVFISEKKYQFETERQELIFALEKEHLPILGELLEDIGELRAGQYYFRCNPFAYRLFETVPFMRKLTSFLLIY